jgi:hypothetical protein
MLLSLLDPSRMSLFFRGIETCERRQWVLINVYSQKRVKIMLESFLSKASKTFVRQSGV